MDRVPITLNLPQDLVERAQSAGLLTEDQVEAWLKSALERDKKLDEFFADLDRLRDAEPQITPEEIDAEIKAYRREKREKRQAAE